MRPEKSRSPEEPRPALGRRAAGQLAALPLVAPAGGAPIVAPPPVLLQNGQLKIAEALNLREALVKELLAFRVKINISTAHDSYEAWREGDHDGLVLSVAMACWAGERFC